jgi:hypothetical protein
MLQFPYSPDAQMGKVANTAHQYIKWLPYAILNKHFSNFLIRTIIQRRTTVRES